MYFTDSHIFGGAEQALLTLMLGLDREQWTPVLAYHPGGGMDPLLDAAAAAGIQLLPVPEMRLGLKGARNMPAVSRLIQREKPDIFHANLSSPLACKWGLMAAVLARVPAVVATLHLFMDVSYTGSARFQQRLIASQVSYITVSKDIARRLTSVFKVPPARIRVIPNAALSEKNLESRPVNLWKDYPQFQNKPVVLTVARLDPQKGHNFLLDAAALIPEAAFVFVGDGPERGSLERQAHLLGVEDRVLFAGYRKDVPAWLASSDLFVLPSLYEGMPISLLEAMSAGLPVIASQIPGNDEVIEHGVSGWLVPPRDVEALAEGIRHLLRNPELTSCMARTGQSWVLQEFSSEKFINRMTQVYRELLDEPE